MKKKKPGAPKIPAYRFKLTNRSTEAARDRLRVLKQKFGVKFGFAANARLTPQRKAAITRVAKKYTEFLNPENGFKFVPLTKGQRKALVKNREVSRAQLTSTGVFVRAPKKAKARVTKDGHIQTTAGRFTSTSKQFAAVDVARDPSIIEKAAKAAGAERVFVSIKGHRGGRRKNGYSLKAFMHYVLETIRADIEAAQDDEEIETPTGKQKSAFKNWFGVEFVKYDWRKVRPNRRKNK